jgi:hypothetical protein
MNTKPTSQQLRLAADIIETGHSWHLYRAGHLYDTSPFGSPQSYVARADAPEGPFEIRLALATPPDNRPLQNPDNLTAEQVGAGYRLTLKDEWNPEQEYWHSTGVWKKPTHYSELDTFRLPLSTPWPEVSKPDPYAELKAAHAAGKIIQCRQTIMNHWGDLKTPEWNAPMEYYRVKPDYQLPPPPPGMKWHREDGWTEEMLPSGYRPLISKETEAQNDEYYLEGRWDKTPAAGMVVATIHTRTTRPLTFTHLGKTWTWHRPGDPMPCDRESKVEILCDDDSTAKSLAGTTCWDGFCCPVGWRYTKPPTKTVDLGPEDVPPGSVFRLKQHPSWFAPSSVIVGGVNFIGDFSSTQLLRNWENLNLHHEINRSIPLTGKWNPTAWEPCHKPKP